MESLSWLCTVLALGMGRGVWGGGGKQWSNWSLDYTQLYPLSPPHSLYTPIYSLSWLLKAEAQHCFWPTPVLYIFAGMTVRFSLREYICTEVFFFFFFLLPCLRVPQVYTHIHAHTHTHSLSLCLALTHITTHTHTRARDLLVGFSYLLVEAQPNLTQLTQHVWSPLPLLLSYFGPHVWNLLPRDRRHCSDPSQGAEGTYQPSEWQFLPPRRWCSLHGCGEGGCTCVCRCDTDT